MALNVVLAGNLIVTDDATGTLNLNKILSAAFAGSLSTLGEAVSIGASPTTLVLPKSPTQVVYIKNLHATQTLTVTWTPNGGGSAVVQTLQPLGFLLLLNSNTTSGITALSVQASGAATPIDYFLAG